MRCYALCITAVGFMFAALTEASRAQFTPADNAPSTNVSPSSNVPPSNPGAPSNTEPRTNFIPDQPGAYEAGITESNGKKTYVLKKTTLTPTKGPRHSYRYENEIARWSILDNVMDQGVGRARYRLNGEFHPNDRLTYLAFGYVEDYEGIEFGYQPGRKVPVWAYLSEDSNGNFIFWYLGVDAIPRTQFAPHQHFPVYYSYDPPSPSAVIIRFFTAGTHRRRL